MIARTAARFGLNYIWGLGNFIAGTVLGGTAVGMAVVVMLSTGAIR